MDPYKSFAGQWGSCIGRPGIETFHDLQQPYSAELDHKPRPCLNPHLSPYPNVRNGRWHPRFAHIHHPSPSPSLLFGVWGHSSAQVALLLACAVWKCFLKVMTIQGCRLQATDCVNLNIKLFLSFDSPLWFTIPTFSTKCSAVAEGVWIKILHSCLYGYGGPQDL